MDISDNEELRNAVLKISHQFYHTLKPEALQNVMLFILYIFIK